MALSADTPLEKSVKQKNKWMCAQISAELINEAKIVFAGASDRGVSLLSDLEAFSSLQSAEEQVLVLKSMAKDLSPCSHLSGDSPFLVKVFVHLLLVAQPKSPVHSCVKSLLVNSDKSFHPYVDDILSASLLEITASLRDHDFYELNSMIFTIQDCFVNFPLGIKVINVHIHNILKFLNGALNHYIIKIKSNGVTAMLKSEISSHIHTACSTLLSLLQKCHRTDFLLKRMQQEDSKRMVEDTLNVCSILANSADVSMDTQHNCGHIIVLLVVFSEEDSGILQLVNSSESLPCRVPRLVVCVGLLSVMQSRQLCQVIPGTQKTSIACLLDQLLLLHERNSSDPVCLLGVCRALEQLWRKLSDILPNTEEHCSPIANVPTLVLQTLPFVWIYLEHHVGAVKNAARIIFQCLVTASTASNDTAMLDTIIDHVAQIPHEKKSKYICIRSVAKLTGTLPLIKKMPDLIWNLISSMEDMTLQTMVCRALDVLLCASYGEMDQHEWVEYWINPLIVTLSSSENTAHIENLLASAFAKHPSCLAQVTANHDVSTPLKVILPCVKIIRRQCSSKLMDSDGSDWRTRLWKGLVAYDTLQQSLWHVNNQLRLSTLELIVDSPKVTEPFCADELLLLQTAMKYNIYSEDPNLRQCVLAVIKKLLNRLSSSALSIERRNKLKTNDDDEAVLQSYSKFISWLVEFCFSNLFPGANSGRRTAALNILTLCVCTFNREMLADKLFSKINGCILFDSLEDSFENNKLLAYNILIQFPADTLQLNNLAYTKSWINVALTLASSVRPTDCITAAYIFLTLASFSETGHALTEVSSCQDDSPTLSAVVLLSNQLAKELNAAKENLLLASVSSPMYGILFCIRTLLQHINLRDVLVVDVWQPLILHVIDMCYLSTMVVAPIVNNSSPEGYLPMDCEVLGGHGTEAKVTSQKVLLCAWRLVKESSLFLGYIAENASIAGKHASGILNKTHMLSMGSHFISLLSEVKHRGAFEQGCVGFTQLCSRLWRHPSEEMKEIPALWLSEILTSMETGDKLCATRRGAGVPFLVQALVVTEVNASAAPRQTHPTVTKLMRLAHEGDALDVRTVSLNVLRALVRHRDLGELVMPHVSNCVELALAGIKSTVWAERNSSTLLFSALMTRMFGVRRSKETLGPEDSMTGYMFFSRYPRLHQIMLDELQLPEEMSTADSRYPTLLMLARLTPSPLGTSQALLQLSVYVPLVRACASSPIFQTRMLAAKALVPLITPDSYVQTLGEIFSQVKTAETANLRHGCLLQLLHLVEAIPSVLADSPLFTQEIYLWVSESLHLLNSINYLATQVYVRILSHFLKYYSHVPASCWEEVKSHLDDHLWRKETRGEGSQVDYGLGKRVFLASVAGLMINLNIVSVKESTNSIEESSRIQETRKTVYDLLQHDNYEVVNVVLDIIFSLFDGKETSHVECEVDFMHIRQLSNSLKDQFKASLSEAEGFPKVLINHIDDKKFGPRYRSKLLQVLHCMPHVLLGMSSDVSDVLDRLLKMCEGENDYIGCDIFKCISSFMYKFVVSVSEYSKLNACTWIKFAKLLNEMASSEKPHANRMSAALALVENHRILQEESIHLPALADCINWSSAVSLLQDDDSDVRNMMASILLFSSSHPPMPERALELLVGLKARRQGTSLKCVVCLVAWSLRDFDAHHIEVDPLTQDCAFDKTGNNIYTEHLVLTDLACIQLKTVCNESMLTSIVEQDMMEWLIEETICDYDTSVPVPTTVREFLQMLQTMTAVNPTLQDLNTSPNTSTHFLYPSHKTLLVDSCRLQKCLAAVNSTESLCSLNLEQMHYDTLIPYGS